MFFTNDLHVIALWQWFPLWMFLAMQLHLLVRPPRPTLVTQTTAKEEVIVKGVSSDDMAASTTAPALGLVTGRKTLQALYGLTIIIATLAHLQLVWPLISSPALLRNALLPHFSTLSSSNSGDTLNINIPLVTRYDPALPDSALVMDPTQVATTALNFLQWDGVFTYGSAMLAALFFARSVREVLTIALWMASTSVTMGPGAALGTVYAWREGRL
jgi:hypothetical protein